MRLPSVLTATDPAFLSSAPIRAVVTVGSLYEPKAWRFYLSFFCLIWGYFRERERVSLPFSRFVAEGRDDTALVGEGVVLTLVWPVGHPSS